jgi:hypothetical protein
MCGELLTTSRAGSGCWIVGVVVSVSGIIRLSISSF